ncbi:hypothetical protein QLX08_003845 [Tetragonisca angustula]|uniref:Uncharacterized protein n=1 Tax=Tetragonisca angustula TaxID=166442 RepID=A0AAW1A4Y1_9HYME
MNPNSSPSSCIDDLPKEAKPETPNTIKLIELATQGSLNAIEHKEITIEDTNANKTRNKRPLSTTSEESIANPVNPSDIYFKTPDPKSTKKSHKETNATSKKPKLKLMIY